MMTRNETRPLTRTQSEWFLGLVTNKFWNAQAKAEKDAGLDGSQWIIEGIQNGRYHIEDKWSPETGPIRDLGLAMVLGLADLKIPKEEIY